MIPHVYNYDLVYQIQCTFTLLLYTEYSYCTTPLVYSIQTVVCPHKAVRGDLIIQLPVNSTHLKISRPSLTVTQPTPHSTPAQDPGISGKKEHAMVRYTPAGSPISILLLHKHTLSAKSMWRHQLLCLHTCHDSRQILRGCGHCSEPSTHTSPALFLDY